jgi:hypothetical protein
MAETKEASNGVQASNNDGTEAKSKSVPTVDDKLKRGAALKEDGNAAFKSGAFVDALRNYHEASDSF